MLKESSTVTITHYFKNGAIAAVFSPLVCKDTLNSFWVGIHSHTTLDSSFKLRAVLALRRAAGDKSLQCYPVRNQVFKTSPMLFSTQYLQEHPCHSICSLRDNNCQSPLPFIFWTPFSGFSELSPIWWLPRCGGTGSDRGRGLSLEEKPFRQKPCNSPLKM